MAPETRGHPDRGSARRPKGRWLLLPALVAAVVLYLSWRAERFGGGTAVEPRLISVARALRHSSVVPASPGALAGCNLLLVTLDTTRADRIGCYGNDEIGTPVLDGLARDGVLFSRAVTSSPVTLPAHATVMTGLYPLHHGARTNTMSRLDEDERTLAEILADAGYATAATVSAFVLDRQFGLDQGFAAYDDEMDPGAPDRARPIERRGDRTTARAASWLREHAAEPFFLWVHYFDPHFPYDPPPPFREQYEHPYDGEIAFVDAELGTLLSVVDEAGLTDRTLVVVVGDHGEGLGQHGEPTHAFLLYDSTLRTPFLMRCGKRLGGGVHVDTLVSLVDVLPTVLSLLGVQAPDGLDGADLTRPVPDRPVFVEAMEALAAYGWAGLVGVHEASLKYVHGPDSELYDLAADPFEQRNLIASRSETASALLEHLTSFYGGDLDEASSLRPGRAPETETLAGLNALGYLGGGGALPPVTDRPHPRDMIPMVERVFDALEAEPRDGLDGVIARLEELVAEHPDFAAAHQHLGEVYLKAGSPRQAEAAYTRCLELRPGQPLALLMLARINRNQGRVEDSAALYRELLERVPGDFAALLELGRMLHRHGRSVEAVAYLTGALRARPRDRETPDVLVKAMTAIGEGSEAAVLLQGHLDDDPGLPAVRLALARLLAAESRDAEAIDVLREGIRLPGDEPDLVDRLAVILATSPDLALRRPKEAADMMERLCRQTGHRNAGYLHTLSLAYAAQSRYDEAIKTAGNARRIASTSGRPGDDRLARSIGKSLESYQAMKGGS